MTDKRQSIVPVILSGGSGSRLWPLSREDLPKQLRRLIGEGTLLQQAVRRATDAELFEPLTVIAAERHRAALVEQLCTAGATDATIVIEPAPRNTAAAAAVAALMVRHSHPAALILLMPADHVIEDNEAFRRTVQEAVAAASSGHLTLFGIKPDSAATGYGYIRVGEPLAAGATAKRVRGFTEKPDEDTAATYLASGEYLWNSGIFLMPVEKLLEELGAFEPELLRSAGEALERATRDGDVLRLEAESFGRCRSISIDYAVMERTDKAAVVPAGFGWMDVGSWSALWSAGARDDAGNVAIGDVLSVATRGSYIRSEGPLVATLGVEDLIVVATDDAVLVARKDKDQDIREILDRLRNRKPERSG